MPSPLPNLANIITVYFNFGVKAWMTTALLFCSSKTMASLQYPNHGASPKIFYQPPLPAEISHYSIAQLLLFPLTPALSLPGESLLMVLAFIFAFLRFSVQISNYHF